MRVIPILILLAIVSACGKSNSSAGIPTKSKVLPVNGSNIVGLYMAKFDTLNTQVNGTLPGSATLQRQNDTFRAYVRLFGGGPNVWHKQNIYMDGRCPTMADDTNFDGYVDINEANNVLGKVLIPLDSNLNSQFAGRNIFPVADNAGSYFYEREAKFDLLFKDLKTPDADLNDNLIKLDPNRGLEFEGMVVMVQGTADTNILPETVASDNGRSLNQSLPIVCGVFQKVTSIPAEPDSTGNTPPGPIEEPKPSTDIDGDGIPDEDDEPTRVERDRWYDRVISWWRRNWERDREGRDQDWGDGEGFVELM